MDLPGDLKADIDAIMRTGGEINDLGWGEGAAGNISILRKKECGNAEPLEVHRLVPLLRKIRGWTVVMSRSGSSFKELYSDPEGSLGIYRIPSSGGEVHLIWGSGPPTTEMMAHLLTYDRIGDDGAAIIHIHPPPGFRLRDPSGVKVIPPLPPGSMELAVETANSAAGKCVILWEGHGLVSIANGPEKALEELISILDAR